MPTPPRVTWKGTTQLTRIGRGRWLFSSQEIVCVLRYRGPYAACLTSLPLIGATIAGYTAYGVKVDHLEICEIDGAIGELTVTLRNPSTDLVVLQTGGSGPSPLQPSGQAGDGLPELRWQPFRRKIESHPLCGQNVANANDAVGPDDGSGSTDAADPPALLDGHIAKINYQRVAGGWDFQDYQSLIIAGLTEYDEPQPILTLATEWYTKPTSFGQNNYQLDTPPNDQGLAIPDPIAGGAAWLWLREGDSLTRENNRWHLHQTWTGFRPGTDRNSAMELLYDKAS